MSIANPVKSYTFVNGETADATEVNTNFDTLYAKDIEMITLLNAATNLNTVSTLVLRDASGNFSAGTITANLTGNVTGNVTGSSGSCTGNSATATNADTVDTFHASQTPAANQVVVVGSGGATLLPGALFIDGTIRVPNNTAYLSRNAANTADAGIIYLDTSDRIKVSQDSFYSSSNYLFWHAGNDGASSGLDADLLDGQHGAYYQPASTAITTSNIAAQTVSAATTATNSAGTGSIPYTRSENGLRIIRGLVSNTGTILEGSGFSVVHAGTGVFTITWTNAFSDIPTVISGISSASSGTCTHVGSESTTGAVVYTWDSVTQGAENSAFNLIAIGPN